MNYLSPSILAADFSKLGEEIQTVVNAGAKMIHLDVMDGQFVPNISFGIPVIAGLRKVTDATFDVHLMIEEPIRYVKEFHDAGADMLTVHYEACNHLMETITAIKQYGMKVGVALNPDTEVSVIEPYLDVIDMVLVMSVYPGFGGQSFIEESVERIRKVRDLADAHNKNDLMIQVDGGIGKGNIIRVVEAGANVLVAGSSVYKGDVSFNTKELVALIS